MSCSPNCLGLLLSWKVQRDCSARKGGIDGKMKSSGVLKWAKSNPCKTYRTTCVSDLWIVFE